MKKSLKELNVYGYPWHVGHQYELAKLFNSYTFQTNYQRTWGEVSRPFPKNGKWALEYTQGAYDLAIFHVDQQCVSPSSQKGRLIKDMQKVIKDIPIVVINHMTPFDDTLETFEVIQAMKDLIGDTPMVVNSKQAAEQWGWGTPIIHGLEPDEWLDLPKEPRIITSLSKAGMSTAYRRELLHETIEILEERGIKVVWIQSDKKFNNFDSYRDYIGRSAIYFNATWQSPMPRSRTEAMMSGACVVSTGHHDWASYIEDGKNGFIVPDNPKAAAALLEDLIMNRYQEVVAIGKAGRETAIKEFHHDRWAADWTTLLTKLGVLA